MRNQNPQRTAALGHDVQGYKLAAFVLAAIYAGAGGVLLGMFQSYMPPDAFALETSGQLVIQTVIGGAGTLIGPAVGAAIWLTLRDLLQQILGVADLWKLILGWIFVVLVTFMPNGIVVEHHCPANAVGAFTRAVRRTAPCRRRRGGGCIACVGAGDRRNALLAPPPATAAAGTLPCAIDARDISMAYGGIHAVALERVDLAVREGEMHGHHRAEWRWQEHAVQGSWRARKRPMRARARFGTLRVDVGRADVREACQARLVREPPDQPALFPEFTVRARTCVPLAPPPSTARLRPDIGRACEGFRRC